MKRTTLLLDISPMAATRPRFARMCSGRVRTYNSPLYDGWKRLMALMTKGRSKENFWPKGTPVTVFLEFVCEHPKNPASPYPKQDADNFAKGILDALTQSAAVWSDDKQVTRLVIEKRYGTPRVTATKTREAKPAEEGSTFVSVADWQPPAERGEQLVWEAVHGLDAQQRASLATEMLERWQGVLDAAQTEQQP